MKTNTPWIIIHRLFRSSKYTNNREKYTFSIDQSIDPICRSTNIYLHVMYRDYDIEKRKKEAFSRVENCTTTMLSRNLVSDIISHAIADVFDLKEKFTEPNIYIHHY